MKKVILFVLLFATTWIADAQVSPSSFLEKLKGTYQATGTSFNMPADIEMTWASTLGGRYYQLQYKIVMHRKDGKDQLFEGTAWKNGTVFGFFLFHEKKHTLHTSLREFLVVLQVYSPVLKGFEIKLSSIFK
jgi:hypothetical protein